MDSVEKITEEEKPLSKKELAIKVGIGLASSGAGICSGLVVKHGLAMITPPPMKPVASIGFEVGKWVISSVLTAAVEQTFAKQMTEVVDALDGYVSGIKLSIGGDKPKEIADGEAKA